MFEFCRTTTRTLLRSRTRVTDVPTFATGLPVSPCSESCGTCFRRQLSFLPRQEEPGRVTLHLTAVLALVLSSVQRLMMLRLDPNTMVARWLVVPALNYSSSCPAVLFRAVAAHGGIPKVSTYSVSKAALNACTKMHAYELKAARIRCAGTCPRRITQSTRVPDKPRPPENMLIAVSLPRECGKSVP